MRLVGGWRMGGPEGDYGLMASLCQRLPREIPSRGGMTRFLRYEAMADGRPRLEFFGMEVERIGEIPSDLVVWELTEREWTVWRSSPDGPAVAWQEEIQWRWLEKARSAAWWLGEFEARGPDAQSSAGGRRPLLLVGHAPVAPGMGVADDVRLVDYDPAWPRKFEEFAGWLRTTLGPETAMRVEHFGSTAIPGMPAKPIIDVLVEVPSFEVAKSRALPRLLGPEWEYWWYGDKITLVRRCRPFGERTHHVHLAPRGHAAWDELGFRDYLRRNPAEADRYAQLKRRLATDHCADREAYTQGKSEFVRRISGLAQQIQGSGR